MNMVNELEQLREFLMEEEKAEATINKYVHEANQLLRFLDGREISKEMLIRYRSHLSGRYSARTVNGKLSAVNAYLRYLGLDGCRVKFLKVQKRAYIEENRELTEIEYSRLMETAMAQGKMQLYYLMMTICSTGIRISELKYVTLEAVLQGRAEISMKGKYRVVILPKGLVKELKNFAQVSNIRSGYMFCTRSGRPLDRSNVCHAMKKLCLQAKVSKSKVFPHNFRHLFARSFYSVEKNMAHLADILGHSSIETTRIYVTASTREYEKVLNRLKIGMIKKVPQNNHSVVHHVKTQL